MADEEPKEEGTEGVEGAEAGADEQQDEQRKTSVPENEDDKKKKRGCGRCCKKTVKVFKETFLASTCLLLINLVYVGFGGKIFEKMEKDSQSDLKDKRVAFDQYVIGQVDHFISQYDNYQQANDTQLQGEIKNQSCEDLKEYGERLVIAYRDYEWRLNASVTKINKKFAGNTVENPWTFSAAMLYCVTVITTIGYGNMVPSTTDSRAMTMVYALIGIPLMLMFIHHLGDNLGQGFEWFYYHVTCLGERQLRWTGSRAAKKPVPDPNAGAVVGEGEAAAGDIPPDGEGGGENPELNTNENKTKKKIKKSQKKFHKIKLLIPLHVSITVIGLYLCLGGFLFSNRGLGTWTFTDAIYFSFITLSTIGFGDLVFNEVNEEKAGGMERNMKALMCGIYIIFGLGLMSMCFDHMTYTFREQLRLFGENAAWLKGKMCKKKAKKQPSIKPEVDPEAPAEGEAANVETTATEEAETA